MENEGLKFQSRRSESESLRQRRTRIGALFALSVAIHGGVFMKNEIGQMIENAPRQARAYMNSVEAGNVAERILVNFQEELESGEPIDMDLSDFYFNDELLRGGISPEQVKQAKEHYESMLTEAQKLLDSGATRNEVLGYVLKMQGDYHRDKALMTDLLTSGSGNCEARAKYISAAVQDLYPDLAKEGKVNYQLFGEYRDKNGNLQDGHIRVVLDEGGDTISILEGDAVFSEEKDPENPIPQFEVTNITAKASLVKSGIYSYADEGMVKDTGITKTAQESAREWSSGRNSLMAFPRSSAKYSDYRGTTNIEPKKVAGSWAKTNLAWSPDFQLEALEHKKEQKPELTIADLSLMRGQDLDLTDYRSASKDVMKELNHFLERVSEDSLRLSISAGFKADFSALSPELSQKLIVSMKGVPEGNELQGLTVKELWVELGAVNEINELSFAGATIRRDGMVVFDLGRKQPNEESVTYMNLEDYKGEKIQEIRLFGDSAKQMVVLPPEMDTITKSIGIADLNIIVEGQKLDFERFSFSHVFDRMSLNEYSLQEALERINADTYFFEFSPQDHVTFQHMSLKQGAKLQMTGGILQKNAFAGKLFDDLEIKGLVGAEKGAMDGVRLQSYYYDEPTQKLLE